MHEDEKTLAEVVRQGRGCRYFYQSPPWPGCPLLGCVPAEPNSVSPSMTQDKAAGVDNQARRALTAAPISLPCPCLKKSHRAQPDAATSKPVDAKIRILRKGDTTELACESIALWWQHQVFPHVTRACQGVPLETIETAKHYMEKAATTLRLERGGPNHRQGL